MNNPTINVTPTMTVLTSTNNPKPLSRDKLPARDACTNEPDSPCQFCQGHRGREHTTPVATEFGLRDPLTYPDRNDIDDPVASPPNQLFSTNKTNISISNNILTLCPMNNDISLLNIDGFHDHIIVYLK